MPTPSSGAISFTDIQTEFGGSNPIGIDEYYQNATQSYTSGVAGIPNTGAAISLNMFYAKSKIVAASVDYMTSGDVAGNMNESGGARMGIDGVDDGFEEGREEGFEDGSSEGSSDGMLDGSALGSRDGT